MDTNKFISQVLQTLVNDWFFIYFFFIPENLQLEFAFFFLKHIRDARESRRQFRNLYVNNQKPPNDTLTKENEPLKYTSNKIKTSKVYESIAHLFL